MSSASSFCPSFCRPNSAACLIAVWVSPPALASATTLAPEAWACNRNEEKSLGVERVPHAAEDLAAARLDAAGPVALQRMTPRVIGPDTPALPPPPAPPLP